MGELHHAQGWRGKITSMLVPALSMLIIGEALNEFVQLRRQF